MYLTRLSLINFKNYDQLDLNFSPKVNCFTGNNGIGKTNLLDAIYYLSFCKSHFSLSDIQNIKHNRDFFVIEGQYENGDKTENVFCGQKRNQPKQFKRNKKEYQRFTEHIGLIPLVMVSPSDTTLVTGGSDERRKYIDSVISQYDRPYLENLVKYNRILNQRNQLLKNFVKTGLVDREMLEIWTHQLLEPGMFIYRKRVDFIQKLLPIFQQYYQYISNQSEIVELIYESQLHETDFKTLLESNVDKDLSLEYTSCGIHKDDLVLRLENFPIKRIGSQGQQKTYLIALKMAQFDFMKDINGYKPILMLDDIFDKLDASRVEQILKLVADEHFGQIFITDTSDIHLEQILTKINIDFKIFKIDRSWHSA